MYPVLGVIVDIFTMSSGTIMSGTARLGGLRKHGKGEYIFCEKLQDRYQCICTWTYGTFIASSLEYLSVVVC